MEVSRVLVRRTVASAPLLQAAQPIVVRRAASRRWLQVSTLPGSATQPDNLPVNPPSLDADGPDARFEVLGAPYSLLSASLSASQALYTRRGTLVGLSGKAENVVSTLSTLEPLRRSLLGIPFFYQKVTSASPVTALISTKSPLTSFTAVHLDGTLDWMVAQRNGLLAWTGQTLSIAPIMNTRLNPGYWGNTRITGRGLVALVGSGNIYELVLGAGDTYIARPSHVLAYTITRSAPSPYRFKSTTLNLQIPGLRGLANLLPDTRFFQALRESEGWRTASNVLRTLRTWTRRTLFGDRLFLHFEGPMTVLLQTRGSRLSDVLSTREINEVADSPAGAVPDAIRTDLTRARALETQATARPPAETRARVAAVGKDGEVKIGEP